MRWTLLILMTAALGSGCSDEFSFCGQFINGGEDEGEERCGYVTEQETFCRPGKRKRISNTSKASGNLNFTAQEATEHLTGTWLGDLYRVYDDDFVLLALELTDVNHGAWFTEQEVKENAPANTVCPPYYEIYLHGVIRLGDKFASNLLNNEQFIAGYRVWSLDDGFMYSDQAPFDWDYTELNGTLTSLYDLQGGESATLRLSGNGEDILYGGLDSYIFADDKSTVIGPDPIGYFSLFQ